MNTEAKAGQAAFDSAATRQRLPPKERREQIVAEAVRFFADVGLDGNTRDLAKRLGVTQSLLFRYFSTKDELLEAVYGTVYLDRLSPDWPERLCDRGVPLRARLIAFYSEYSALIFQREWMRIFMFSGLAGAALNRRYLEHLGEVILGPLLEETARLTRTARRPIMEDVWDLHGGIVYIGIRQHIYSMPAPDDPEEAIARAIDKYLAAFGIGPQD
ncbi:transcriptional regulator, TetR family (plasmid) [Dinoroseobacter shibae DFL 12 = DSM 16493]|uniref:Transcriptional regulator, TetR family n=1 Tax=Dinoroseobacter shibae (strain DSM 16493 / NCIMB 14021 / DFL 12) TaxID=398580 RepID=A8LUJ2_DINSH|nr:TetR/AcrR family transcriptional regulator [Dinoroseobacter shibae]ABV95909.1 transcriptional regulator, TetR family [Dinoroseobacter shibae DFL 12 = DSM 16493]URF49151.1 TetR/AcrR family transcriptional regulator [Dinoroseobacter shibae]URF53459.1 TetR/AcrR family transcriptional regulator [Dinoroseobacter shibae]